jgi:hypothetical protein
MRSIFVWGSNLSPIASKLADRVARSLLCSAVQMPPTTLIGIRHLWAGPSKALVLLTRNEGGSIAGHCILNGERAVIDGQTAGLVLGVIEDVLEVLSLARRPSNWRAWRET